MVLGGPLPHVMAAKGGRLLAAGVVVNRNSISQDPNGAWYTAGVSLGTLR